MNICVLGDSISKGVVFDGISSRYNQLKDNYVSLLKKKFGFAIENFSKFGCTVTKGLAMLDFHKDKVSQSQYVLIEYGGNDSDFHWDEVAKEPDAVHFPMTTREDFRSKYNAMIDEIQSIGATPILLNLPPIDAQRFFDRVSQGKSRENILHYLGGDVQFIYRWHESYNLEISSIAYDKKVPLIDIRTAFLLDKNSKELLCEDGMHPSEKGHMLIAQSISDYLEKAS